MSFLVRPTCQVGCPLARGIFKKSTVLKNINSGGENKFSIIVLQSTVVQQN